jgi:DNA repair protein SbcC/Rad50
MQLRRIRVRNIRSYESSEVELSSGTTLLAGDVGAGKTSLLYAVEMALFGVAEVEAAYLVRHGAAHAEVEVELEGGGHRYVVRRRFRKVQRRGRPAFEPERISFSVDGATTVYSATELRQRVIELLGFPDNPRPQAHSELWRWAVYVPQERMRDILAADPHVRLETVRRALGVERYRVAAENAQESATDLRRSAAARRAEADRLSHHDREHAEWIVESDRLHLDRSRLQSTIAEREREVDTARERRDSAASAVREVESMRTVRESLGREDESDARSLREGARVRAERSAEIERLSADRAAAQTEAASLERSREAREQAEQARDRERARVEALVRPLRELAEARAQRSAAAQVLEDARARADRAGNELAMARERRDAAWGEGPARAPPAPTTNTVSALDERLSAARETERSALAALALAQHARSELEELLTAGTCPRCGQTVNPAEFGAHRAEAEAALGEAEETHRKSTQARSTLEDERRSRERYDRAMDRWSEIQKRRSLADATLATAESGVRLASEAFAQAEAARARLTERELALAPLEGDDLRARDALDAAERRLREEAQLFERSSRAADRLNAIDAAREAIGRELERQGRDLASVLARKEERSRRIAELDGLLDSAGGRREAMRGADRGLADAEAGLADERRILVRVETRLDEAARRIEEAERGRSERTELLRVADDLAGKAAWVGGPFRTAVLAMEQELLAHAQTVFERSFARYFASLVDDPALLARTDAAFTPGVTIDDEWTPAEALSGGERTSLALAFRLALAHVVRVMGSLRLDSLLLDEPTDGFSPEQVVRMGELLDELGLPQVVLVSHEGELAAIADRVLRVEKRGGRSTVSRPDGPPLAPGSAEPPSAGESAPEPPSEIRPRRRRTERLS